MTYSFTDGQWNPEVWTLVKSPRWDHFGRWVQRAGSIENHTPPDATAQTMLGPHAPQTYTSMVLTRKVRTPVTISSTMEFTHRMAPMIVIAPQLGADAAGRPEYREHFEIVIFDEGVNVWHHVFNDAKPSYVKAADARFPLQPNVKYQLEVTIGPATAGGGSGGGSGGGDGSGGRRRMLVAVAGHTLDFETDALPDELHVGITGCEGVNRFYDFEVRRK